MRTECSADLFGFAAVEGRKVVGGFDGGAITSDAGALLLGAADRAIRLTERFAACFHDTRRQHLIEHEVVTLLRQRVFGIALGYEDLNDHDELRRDPMMAVLAGKLAARREDCAPVAGKSTLNRLAATMRANQLRLWLASFAYVLLCAVRRIGLHHTPFANASCGTIRLKLLKIGALVRVSVRRIKIAMASSCPAAEVWGCAAVRLVAASARGSPA
jgi:Transposase DDE domain group 1